MNTVTEIVMPDGRHGLSTARVGVHILIWVEHNGAAPDSHAVLFTDRNKRNSAPENFECISRAAIAKADAA